MKAAINGTRIYFDIDGAGVADGETRPVVFLLHGGPGGSSETFRDRAFDFTDVAQLVYVDNRGCGRSAAGNPATYTLDQNIEDIEALRRYLGLDRIVVLGYSYGGMVAQGYAIRYPDALDKLILLATAPSYRFLAAAREEVSRRCTPEQHMACQRLFDGNFETDEQVKAYYRLMGPLYARSFDPAGFEAKWEPGSVCLPALNLGFGGFLREFDWLPRLPSVRCPCLVMGGAHDWICPIGQSAAIVERLPDARYEVFAHSGHLIPQDETERFQQTVRDFLAD